MPDSTYRWQDYAEPVTTTMADFTEPSSKSSNKSGGSNILPWLLAGTDIIDKVNESFFGGSPGGYRPAGGRLQEYLQKQDTNSMLERILASVAGKRDEEAERYSDYDPSKKDMSTIEVLGKLLGGVR